MDLVKEQGSKGVFFFFRLGPKSNYLYYYSNKTLIIVWIERLVSRSFARPEKCALCLLYLLWFLVFLFERHNSSLMLNRLAFLCLYDVFFVKVEDFCALY